MKKKESVIFGRVDSQLKKQVEIYCVQNDLTMKKFIEISLLKQLGVKLEKDRVNVNKEVLHNLMDAVDKLTIN